MVTIPSGFYGDDYRVETKEIPSDQIPEGIVGKFVDAQFFDPTSSNLVGKLNYVSIGQHSESSPIHTPYDLGHIPPEAVEWAANYLQQQYGAHPDQPFAQLNVHYQLDLPDIGNQDLDLVLDFQLGDNFSLDAIKVNVHNQILKKLGYSNDDCPVELDAFSQQDVDGVGPYCEGYLAGHKTGQNSYHGFGAGFTSAALLAAIFMAVGTKRKRT